MLGWRMCCILLIQPLKLYLSPAHQFVLTGLPQWWLHHPDAAEQLASQPWHAVKRSSQPSARAFFCPIKPQNPSHPVQPATVRKTVSLCMLSMLSTSHATTLSGFDVVLKYVFYFTLKFLGYKSWIIHSWFEVTTYSRNCDNGSRQYMMGCDLRGWSRRGLIMISHIGARGPIYW